MPARAWEFKSPHPHHERTPAPTRILSEHMRIVSLLVISGLAALLLAGQSKERALFNGKNLDGWQVVGDGKWTVLGDGMLMGQAVSGAKNPFGSAWPVTLDEKGYMDWRQTQSWLYTNEEFGEFDLHVEYLTPEGGNSGISIRDQTRGKHAIGPKPDYNRTPAHNGYEIQIMNGAKGKYPSGSLYLFAPAKTGREKVSDWNALDIESRDDMIRIKLNGEEVARHAGDAARPKRGPIGLQLHDRFSVILFRNIRLREIGR